MKKLIILGYILYIIGILLVIPSVYLKSLEIIFLAISVVAEGMVLITDIHFSDTQWRLLLGHVPGDKFLIRYRLITAIIFGLIIIILTIDIIYSLIHHISLTTTF